MLGVPQEYDRPTLFELLGSAGGFEVALQPHPALVVVTLNAHGTDMDLAPTLWLHGLRVTESDRRKASQEYARPT